MTFGFVRTPRGILKTQPNGMSCSARDWGMNSVEQTLNRISENPSLYPVVHRDSRRALIRKFPFGVHYVVTGDSVVVIAVMHVRRDPRRWKSRT